MTPEERTARIAAMPSGPTKTMFEAFEKGERNPRSMRCVWEELTAEPSMPFETDAERQARAMAVNSMIEASRVMLEQARRLAMNQGPMRSSAFDLMSRKDNYDFCSFMNYGLRGLMERITARGSLDLIDQGFEGVVESAIKG